MPRSQRSAVTALPYDGSGYLELFDTYEDIFHVIDSLAGVLDDCRKNYFAASTESLL